MEKKLFRNEHDKMIGGVASGLADYMQIEVTIVRLLFVLSAFFFVGGGLLAYIIMWIVIPSNPDPNAKFSKFNDYFNKNNTNATPFGNAGSSYTNPQNFSNWSQPVNDAQKTPFETQPDFAKFHKKNDSGRTIAGLAMLVIGCFFLMRQLDFIPDWFTIRNFFKFMWPMVFIALGISIIAKSKRKNEWVSFQQQQAEENQPKSADFSNSVSTDEKPNEENNPSSTNPQT